ncbi:hypothetical protein AKJ16_DCAP05373 [Drosera capensis]
MLRVFGLKFDGRKRYNLERNRGFPKICMNECCEASSSRLVYRPMKVASRQSYMRPYRSMNKVAF